jgi:hypothetical protein
MYDKPSMFLTRRPAEETPEKKRPGAAVIQSERRAA